jgi:hypothetical protein
VSTSTSKEIRSEEEVGKVGGTSAPPKFDCGSFASV